MVFETRRFLLLFLRFKIRAVPLKKNLMCGFRKTCFSKTKEKCGCLSPSSVHGLGNDDESEVKKIATIILEHVLEVGQSSKKVDIIWGGKKMFAQKLERDKEIVAECKPPHAYTQRNENFRYKDG